MAMRTAAGSCGGWSDGCASSPPDSNRGRNDARGTFVTPCGRGRLTRRGVTLRRGFGAMLYEIRITGRISEAALEEFGDLVATIEPPRTVLRGPTLDQAALPEVLDRAARLGLRVEEVRVSPRRPSAQRSRRAPPPRARRGG